MLRERVEEISIVSFFWGGGMGCCLHVPPLTKHVEAGRSFHEQIYFEQSEPAKSKPPAIHFQIIDYKNMADLRVHGSSTVQRPMSKRM